MAEFGSTVIDQMNTTINALNTAVNTLKNTDVANLSANVNGLGWWSKYLQVQKKSMSYTAAALGGSNVLGTVVNITGKGYLRKSLNSGGRMKITLDGVVILDAIPSTAYCGIVDLLSIIGLSTGKPIVIGMGATMTLNTYDYLLPYTNAVATEYYCSIANPLFFNTSLKIELATTTTAYLEAEYGEI
jgi:hypothetical protein